MTTAKRSHEHIVDILIEERADRLATRPLAWWAIRTFLYPILKYHEAIALADELEALPGLEAFERVSERMNLTIEVEGLDHIPKRGPLLIVANHPTGIPDGVAVFDVLKDRRPDLCFFANRDAIRVAQGFLDVLIPVEWVEDKRTRAKTRETLQHTARAFGERRAVVMFPSGGIAQKTAQGLKEKPWFTTTLGLIRKHKVPAVPLHIDARNSALYYFFWKVSPELRNMTLFSEMLNKQHQPFRLTFGRPIAPEDLAGDPNQMTERLRDYVQFELSKGRDWAR